VRHAATLWSADDVNITIGDGHRFECLLFKSVTTDDTMWVCGFNPYYEHGYVAEL
jgi:hypothetical protein